MNKQQLDPSIYQYDEIYQQIKAPKKSKPIQKDAKPSTQKNQPTGSKYIGKMKTIVQRRQKDHKRAYERKQQKINQRLGIGEEEVFVTQSYMKKKMEEEEAHRKEKNQEQEDIKNSVQNRENGEKKMNDFRRKLLDGDT